MLEQRRLRGRTSPTTPTTVAEKGQVLEQSPEAYTEQPQGTRVVITVSSYEEPSAEPDADPDDDAVAPSPSAERGRPTARASAE